MLHNVRHDNAARAAMVEATANIHRGFLDARYFIKQLTCVISYLHGSRLHSTHVSLLKCHVANKAFPPNPDKSRAQHKYLMSE